MIKSYKAISILIVLLVAVLMTAPGCKLKKDSVDPMTPTTPGGSTYDPTALYNNSGHADETAEAFRHWDEDDPPLVSASCAKCHSNDGFLDFIADGVVDGPASPGVIGCNVCHADPGSGVTHALESVTFPSGAVIGGLGDMTICAQCHQGRYSGNGVESYLAARGPTTGDVVNPSLSFRNIHYFAASATLFGKFAWGGYQYAGKMYDGRLNHVEDYDSCTDCHDPHSLQVKTEECMECHSFGDIKDIRHKGSYVDYDGDGNWAEGVYWEIVGLREFLQNAMWSYSMDVSGAAIVYESHTYPYFFKDTNGNGVADPEEANYGNQFRLYTPRLLKAAYNFQVAMKDLGAFAHGGKYVIQLLYDSLMDLNGAAPNPIPIPMLHRDDEGHFDGAGEAFRHWDEDGGVSASCAKCHSGNGLAEYLDTGGNEEAHIASGMFCTNCHTSDNATGGNVRVQTEVEFPSGAMLSLADSSNLCMNCHSGRAYKGSVDDKIAGGSGNYTFTNIHYFPAAAILFGTEAQGGYEYPGKTYVGRKMFVAHEDRFDTCVKCHMGTRGADYSIAHNVQKPNPVDCAFCHGNDVAQPYPGYDPAKFSFDYIRPGSVPDYDGDGNMTESIKMEIKGLEYTLYEYIKKKGRIDGKPIIYDSHAYPYFFNDNNNNGLSDPGEAIYPNRYRFSANLLKAAYNYQVSKKEPHAYIHNSMYVAQLLVDSIGDLGGNVAPYTWR